MQKEIRLITSALPYINNVPHLGHIAGCHLPADIFYRYCKLRGFDTLFIGGSDEYGTPSLIAANELGVNIKFFVDKLHQIHKSIYEKFDISYDNYSRTSTDIHKETVINFFNEIKDSGYILEEETQMYFCEHDQMFLPDRFVKGTCPNCGNEDANSDQCEVCNKTMNVNELINPKCVICGNTPVIKSTKHLYLDLSKLSDKINDYVENHKSIWRNYVYTEAKKWINEGLKKRSITRDLSWGVPVLNIEGFEKKVFYVWFDAPIGYITFVKELGLNLYEKYWKNKDAKIYHFLGKDNIPFHTIFWPAMLIVNKNYNIPDYICGYHYLNYEGKKFSKSKKTGVFCYNLLKSDINIDTLRVYLTSILPENKDSDFKWEEYKNTINNELIAKFANFFNRTLSLINKFFDGQLNIDFDDIKDLIDDDDKMIINTIKNIKSELEPLFEEIRFVSLYNKIIEYSATGNIYLEKTSPWKKIKEGKINEACKSLYLSLCLARSLNIIMYPIAPKSMLDMRKNQLNFDFEINNDNIWNEISSLYIPKNHKVNKPVPLYKVIDDEILQILKNTLSFVPDLKDII